MATEIQVVLLFCSPIITILIMVLIDLIGWAIELLESNKPLNKNEIDVVEVINKRKFYAHMGYDLQRLENFLQTKNIVEYRNGQKYVVQFAVY